MSTLVVHWRTADALFARSLPLRGVPLQARYTVQPGRSATARPRLGHRDRRHRRRRHDRVVDISPTPTPPAPPSPSTPAHRSARSATSPPAASTPWPRTTARPTPCCSRCKLNTLTQPAPGVGQRPNGQPPGGDALLVAPRRPGSAPPSTSGCPTSTPTSRTGGSAGPTGSPRWTPRCTTRLAATGTSNINGWELWNEPDCTWNTGRGGSFNAGWVTHLPAGPGRGHADPDRRPEHGDLQRSLDALVPHQRPGQQRAAGHHLLARAGARTSNVAARHRQLPGARVVARDQPAARSPSTSTPHRPRSTTPAPVAGYIAKFERGGVDNAERAFWYEYGTVNGLTVNNQPTGSWWLYKWYGDMAGNMVATTPPCAVRARRLRLLRPAPAGSSTSSSAAGPAPTSSGSTDCRRWAAGAGAGWSRRPASGRFTAVSAPTTISTRRPPSATGADRDGAQHERQRGYHLRHPADQRRPTYQQRYEAENASIFRANRFGSSSASAGAYVGQIDNTGDSAHRQLRRLHRQRADRPRLHDDASGTPTRPAPPRPTGWPTTAAPGRR